MPIVEQGATVNLTAEYKDASGALVDPTSPLLSVIDPSDVTVSSGLAPVRDSIGEYHYDWLVPVDAALGNWIGRFSGVIGGATVSGDDPFTVAPQGSIIAGANDLITLNEFKAAKGVPLTDDAADSTYAWLISAASEVILTFTERSFGAPLVTEDRTFEYDNSGYLDIDDCAEVNSVSLVTFAFPDYLLTPDQWWAGPQRRRDAPVYEYITLPFNANQYAISPEMGFSRNLDVWAAEGRLAWLRPQIKVSAVWGWPIVPLPVKQAAIWTVEDWLTRNEGEVQVESIENFSRSWQQRGTAAGIGRSVAIPQRAQDILADFQRPRV